MEPRRYGPFPYTPIRGRSKLNWPNCARSALWVAPNIEFFHFNLGDIQYIVHQLQQVFGVADDFAGAALDFRWINEVFEDAFGKTDDRRHRGA